MEKTIKIGEKEFKLHSSALTQFSYKNETGRSLLEDIKKLIPLAEMNITAENMEILDNITELVLPLTYVMVKEYDKSQALNYEEFLKSIDDLYGNLDWINEVIITGCSPISRQLQNN